jgi:P-type Ca2+ transporter type 2C
LGIRSNTESLFRQGLLSNKALLGSVVAVVTLQLIVIYLPALHELFGSVPLSPLQLAGTVLAGSVVLWVVEIEKALRRRK